METNWTQIAVIVTMGMFVLQGLGQIIWYLIKRKDRGADQRERSESEEISAIRNSLSELRNDNKIIKTKLDNLITKLDTTNTLVERHDDEIKDLKRDIKIIGSAHRKQHAEELPLS
jgi:peptidoglycan hydrolase CwlO-like protein